MTVAQYENPNRPRTAAELAHPGEDPRMFYDPERPADSFDGIRYTQRQRTLASSRQQHLDAQRRAASYQPSAVTRPAAVTVSAKVARVAASVAATVVALPIAANTDEHAFPMHMLRGNDMEFAAASA
jgi:hypothetical protein